MRESLSVTKSLIESELTELEDILGLSNGCVEFDSEYARQTSVKGIFNQVIVNIECYGGDRMSPPAETKEERAEEWDFIYSASQRLTKIIMSMYDKQ